MITSCPACSEKTITRFAMLRSASGIESNPTCSQCHARWTIGRPWQDFFSGFALLAFMFSAVFSVKERSYAPYILALVVLLFVSFFVCSYAKTKVIVATAMRLSLLHYFVLTFFVVALFKFFAS